MLKILKIVKREYFAAVRTKGFIIGLVMAPIFMSGSFIVIKFMEGRVDTKDKRIAVVDRSGLVSSALKEAAKKRNATEIFDRKTGKKVRPSYIIEIIKPDNENPTGQRLQLSNQVRNKQLHAFLEIGSGILHPRSDSANAHITYHSENAIFDEVRNWLSGPINDRVQTLRLEEVGLNKSVIKEIFNWLPIEGLGLFSADEQTGKVKKAQRVGELEALGVPYIMLMLMFMMLMMGAMPLLNTVMEEKLQRISEVLLGSVKPFEFMMGKVLGGVCVSLTGAAVYVIVGVIGVTYAGKGKYIPYEGLPWFFVYMILAIVMVGAMFAALGASCNDSKDAQSLAFPAMMPVLIPMFIAMPVLREPNAAFATWTSLFPLFTPMLMMIRLSVPQSIPVWQPWVGLVGMILFTLISVWVGARIFRVGILMQGKPPRLSEIVRWAVRG